MRLRSIFVCLAMAIPGKAAEVAMVGDEVGQAFLFTNRGLCYAALPNHISAHADRIALAVASPAQNGAGEIFWRDAENDLALAFVEGELSTRCRVDFGDLDADLSASLQSTEAGLIKSVHFGGDFFDRIGAAIVDVDDRFVSVKVTSAGVDAEVMQGLSGSMLSVGGRPAGIAIDASSSGEARFLRMDRLAAMIAGNIAADHPSTRAIETSDSGLGFRVTGFGGGEDVGIVALEPGSLNAPWITEWRGAPIGFEITLSNDKLVPIDRITMGTITSETTTMPRRVAIELDRGMPGAPYWTGLAAPDMSPTGVFEISTGGTVGRRLRIRILDVWHPDRPIRLDWLNIE